MRRALALAMILAAAAGAAPRPLTLSVSPVRALAPADLTLVARVEPHADNIWISFAADSGTAARSSGYSLEGDKAPRMHEVRWRDLRAGDYLIVVAVIGKDGKPRARVTARVYRMGRNTQ